MPTWDQKQVAKKRKDAKIEQLLRPSLPKKMSEDAEAEVDEILDRRGVIAKFEREQVSDRDIARLMPSQWLNDEIINFYGSLIQARAEGGKENPTATATKKGRRSRPLNAHYFSSFFYSKLKNEGYDRGRLAKWTKKVSYKHCR